MDSTAAELKLGLIDGKINSIQLVTGKITYIRNMAWGHQIAHKIAIGVSGVSVDPV